MAQHIFVGMIPFMLTIYLSLSLFIVCSHSLGECGSHVRVIFDSFLLSNHISTWPKLCSGFMAVHGH